MIGAIAELRDIELSEVEAAVGPTAFRRGLEYADANRVVALEWEPEDEVLSGSVIASGGFYSTWAFFITDDFDGRLVLEGGECTCPVAEGCEHVAAIAIAGVTGVGASERLQSRDRLPELAAPGPQPWERGLQALLGTPGEQAGGAPLAIEITLLTAGGSAGATLRLAARVMRPGVRGGWVNGSLSWSRLDDWQLGGSQYRRDHLDLLRELYAVHAATQGRAGYYHAYGDQKTLDLGACNGRQLWWLLDEAARLGIALIHDRPELGEIALHARGEVRLDARRHDGGGLLLSPIVAVDGLRGDELLPLQFLGTSGHGAVCVHSADLAAGRSLGEHRLHLVPLARPAPPALRRMFADGTGVEIPPGEVERFAGEICPDLYGTAPVVSSDGSFTPPEISAPTLVLRAMFRPGHVIELAWEWRYRIGARTRGMPLAPEDGAGGFRDHAAERALTGEAVLALTGHEAYGLLDVAGQPATAPVTLGGLDSLRLATDVLPRLADRPGIEVEIDGAPPDYRDVGDSVAIGLSTAEIDGERDWFDLGITITVDGRELPFADVFTALASGESHMLLHDGAHFSLLTPRLQSLRTLIDEARGLADAPLSSLRISRYQAGLWDELTSLGVVTEQAQAWQRQVSALLEIEALAEHEPPAVLAAELRPYQREGFRWLAALWELELGGILADDMGLGKTLQTLALICHARQPGPAEAPSAAPRRAESRPARARAAQRSSDRARAKQPRRGGLPFLVVAPTSVVANWAAEAARFAPTLTVEVVADTLARSGRTIDDVAHADVVVTTYTLFRLEAEAYCRVEWAGLILDEAQYVKNHQSKTYRCARELPAPVKVAITGTPMENNLMELWSLLSITAPGLFPDPKRFAERYARPIERGGDAERLALLRRRIKPLVLRRTKELVASELPLKQEQMLDVELHPRHRKLYDVHLQRERQRILRLIGDFDRNRFTILRSITLLRQLSLHPGLVDADHDRVPCAKSGALLDQLRHVIDGGHRALVFSQFTRFLSRIRGELEAQGIDYCYLDGGTRRRRDVLDAFKAGDAPVFLISLKAGGFGLNLTEADYCFLLDPWWNPATEAQAVDRTHRIGQTRPVMVYRVIARDTIEEKVVALARRKAALFSGVMDDGALFASSVTADDIRGLLG